MAQSKEPTTAEVDKAMWEVAARTLDGQPTGSAVMVDGCLGIKKMGFYWVLRVHGIRTAIRQAYRDAKAR